MPISELRSESQYCADVHSAWGESEGARIWIIRINREFSKGYSYFSIARNFKYNVMIHTTVVWKIFVVKICTPSNLRKLNARNKQRIINENFFYEYTRPRRRCCCCQAMSIRSYLKPRNGLPDPKGPLSLTLPPQAIALANSEARSQPKTVARNAFTDTA